METIYRAAISEGASLGPRIPHMANRRGRHQPESRYPLAACVTHVKPLGGTPSHACGSTDHHSKTPRRLPHRSEAAQAWPMGADELELLGGGLNSTHPVFGWVSIPYHSTVSRTFNSLFKVLCIFRSLYLFAIGLVPIFSLMRGIPHN